MTDWYPPAVGGVESHTSDLARELARRGHRVHVVTTSRGAVAESSGVTVHRLPFARLPLTNVAAPNLLRLPLLRSLLHSIDADVVHSQGMFSTCAIGGVMAARMAGIPSVFTLQSLIGAPVPRAAARLIFATVARHATVITAVSDAVARDARRLSGRSDIEVLPNGIAVEPDVSRPPATRRPGTKHVISVMRLTAKKHPQDLLAAIPRIVAACPGVPLSFTIVGGGPKLASLKREAVRLGLQNRIEFCGVCSRAQVDEKLATADLFLLPCRAEGFGIAALEARRAGVPVVAMKRGGIPDLIEHGRHGLLASTPDEFVRHAARALTDTRLLAHLRASVRDGLDEFAWDATIPRLLQIYEHAAGVGSRP